MFCLFPSILLGEIETSYALGYWDRIDPGKLPASGYTRRMRQIARDTTMLHLLFGIYTLMSSQNTNDRCKRVILGILRPDIPAALVFFLGRGELINGEPERRELEPGHLLVDLLRDFIHASLEGVAVLRDVPGAERLEGEA